MGVAEQIQPRLEAAIGQRYEVIGPIGRGGMASVYLARHRVHGGFCAVKVLADHLAKQPPLVKSFLTEARASASLDEHPNIVNIVDIDEHAGLYYMIMKYVEGEDLSTYMQRKKKLPWKQAAYIAAEVAEALSYSHERGVIHRDLKPSNIRLNRRGGVTVMDFGIAKVGQTPSSFTEMGTRAGTPHYMAPEQITGAKVDHRSDLYGLGVILYQMVTGKRPFDGPNPAMVWQAHLTVEPAMPQELEPSIPDPLSHIILTLLAKDVDKRYDSAERVVRHLQTLDLEGVRTTIDAVDQLDLDALRNRTLAEMTVSQAVEARPGIAETGQTAAPPALDEPAQEAPPASTATKPPADAHQQPTAVEPAPLEEPPAPEATPAPEAAPAPEPTPEAIPATEPTSTSETASAEPTPVAEEQPQQTSPAASETLPEPSPEPLLPPPAPRPPATVTEPFALPAAKSSNRKPLLIGVGLVAALAVGAFLLVSGGGEPAAAPPGPVVKEAAPSVVAEEAPAEPAAEVAEAAPASEAAPPAPAKPAPPRTGAVYFRTQPPGARIQVDNRPDWTCESPCWLESLTAGEHSVTARLDGFKVAIEKVQVTAGARDPLELRLQPDVISAMIASSPPGAEIYIDGEKRPEKTNARIPLRAGTYQVRVVLPGVAEGEQVLVVSESQMPYANFVLQ